MALGLAAPASAMQSAAPIGPASPQTAPASASPAPSPTLSTAPSPPVAASSPQDVSTPGWERTPSGDDLARLYPSKAMNRNLEGEAVMACMVRKDGTLTDCTVVQETPAGLGFGEATLATARYFKMTATTAGGTSVEGGKVLIPLHWRLN